MSGCQDSPKCEYVPNANQDCGTRSENKESKNDIPYGCCHCGCGQKTTISLVNNKNYGYVKGEPVRFIQNHLHYTGNHVKHGMIGTPEYKTWDGMKYRCRDPRCKDYPTYGGRGIKICERWEKSFQNFYDDVGKRPTLQHTIERINNDGDYEPLNCKWATKTEQRHNNRIPKNNTTGIRGVSWVAKSNKYSVIIGFCGKMIHIGRFKTLPEAAEARRQAEIKYWGK